MIRSILLFISFLLLMGSTMADEGGLSNNSTMTGENLSAFPDNDTNVDFGNISLPYGQTPAGFQGNNTRVNLTNTTPEGDENLSNSLTPYYGNQTSARTQPTPTQVYKLSIGSVYEPDYIEPEGRTFSYSGCP